MRTFQKVSFVGLLVAGVAACSAPVQAPASVASPSSTVAPAASASPEAKEAQGAHAEACAHMADGPARAVEASLSSEGRGAVAADHHRYDVKLQPQGSTFGGNVVFNNAMAGDVKFYLGFAGPATAEQTLTLMQDGKRVEFEKVDSEHVHEECVDVKVHYVAELGVGPVEIRLAGMSENAARLVIEGASEDGHHDHDHD